MKLWLHKIELLVDRLIPFSLLLLTILIIIEFFFKEIAAKYEFWIVLFDYVIIFVFVLDLIFKYIRIKPFKQFLKKSWLDILVIFPFASIFRLIEGVFDIFKISESLREGQSVVRGVLNVEKEAVKIVEEVEKIGKISRTSKFMRYIRPIARTPRLLKAVTFYEKPTGKHHLHD